MRFWNVEYALVFTLPCPKTTGVISVIAETSDLAAKNAEAQILYWNKYVGCGTTSWITTKVTEFNPCAKAMPSAKIPTPSINPKNT